MPKVVVVNAPNSNMVFSDRLCTVTNPAEHSDWSDYLCLGLLTLCSAVDRIEGVEAIYLDGAIAPFEYIESYIDENASQILVVAVSALTANYEACIHLLRRAKEVRPGIVTVIGNDHFTALYDSCMKNQQSIDIGFTGNDVVRSFQSFVSDLVTGTATDLGRYPGAVWRDASIFTDHLNDRSESLPNGTTLLLIARILTRLSIVSNFSVESPRS